MKKAQVAMEMLMTYGMVILLVLAAILMLLNIGVIHPKTPTWSCLFKPGITCLDAKVTSTEVEIVIKNGLRDSITVTDLSIDNCHTATGDVFLPQDETYKFVINQGSCNFGKPNTLFRKDVKLSYTPETGTTHTVTGTIDKIVE